ncbi:MAG: prenyltransferase [Candidatus Lambdaproteobacteria bacterium]|nr:prenyltransferase [Candidatus Lambdaproteobacteria bacterium]
MTVHVGAQAPHPNLFQGIWHLADPKITLASVASMVLATGLAAHDGELAWGWLAVTVLGIFAFEAAKNASGEIVDWNSGTDRALQPAERTPFSGGKRVIVDGLLTPRQTAFVAAAFYALGILAGLAIVIWREPAALWFGLAGTALAFFYHAPPLKLSYRGWGEAAVALAYGPLIACGTYLVQRHTLTPALVLATVPLGLAVMAFLWINEFPDARADAQAGKRTLVVRLGLPAAARAYALLVAVTYGWLLLLPLAGLPPTIWLGLAGLPHAVAAARRLLRHAQTPAELVPAQTWTLLAFLLLAVGSAAGMLLARALGMLWLGA